MAGIRAILSLLLVCSVAAYPYDRMKASEVGRGVCGCKRPDGVLPSPFCLCSTVPLTTVYRCLVRTPPHRHSVPEADAGAAAE